MDKKKAIIFGANGQDGFYLSRLLIKNQIDVTGVSRGGDFLKMDITHFEEVVDLIKKILPDYIFHLAANSTTRHNALLENHHTIATGTLNILEAVKNFSPNTKVFISGSGLQFKNEGKPIKETDAFAANDAYAVSRIQSVYAARYFRTLGIKTYVGYFFNHDSPLRTERHVAKKISAAAKRIGEGSDEKLEIGDTSVIKEWTFAGDVVKGVWQFINQDIIFEANISSGLGYSIQQWIEACFDVIGRNPKDCITGTDNFKSEYKQLVSDASVIHSIGFMPKVSFTELAKMMVKDEQQ